MTITLVRLDDFPFTNDYSYHRTLTCVNHPQQRWFTKNPYDRSIFYMPSAGDPTECRCPADDLRVVVEESQPPSAP